MFYISDYNIIFGIRIFVFLLSTIILLAEILSGGVGTFLLFNLLTGAPLSPQTMKGFSGKVLSGMFYWLNLLVKNIGRPVTLTYFSILIRNSISLSF